KSGRPATLLTATSALQGDFFQAFIQPAIVLDELRALPDRFTKATRWPRCGQCVQDVSLMVSSIADGEPQDGAIFRCEFHRGFLAPRDECRQRFIFFRATFLFTSSSIVFASC